MSERLFSIIPERRKDKAIEPHPMSIPWSVAELAYSVYAKQCGTGQSLARLAERGGFHAGEMDQLLPDWRARASELTAAQQRVAELERECESMRGLLQASRVSSDRDMREKCSIEAENARLLKRVDDLEVAVANGMNDATRFVDRNGWLESEHQRLKQENERLRGLLREAEPVLRARAFMLAARVQAELGKGE